MNVNDVERKMFLINRMNAEMKAITNSPSAEVQTFRIALLANLGLDLKNTNDRIRRKTRRVGSTL